MNVLDSVKALNQRAAREHWYHACDPSLTFSDPSYDKLLALWRAKAGDRPMPRRVEISARDLKDVLRHLMLFERVEHVVGVGSNDDQDTVDCTYTNQAKGTLIVEKVTADTAGSFSFTST